MTSGLSNADKARTRALYAQGQATREPAFGMNALWIPGERASERAA